MHPFVRGSLNQSHFDSDPFKDMKISDCRVLDDVGDRSACPQCHKSRKYFCYVCFLPVIELQGKIPQLNLPVHIDIIKHRREIDGKSTAAHAAVLAPKHVSIYTYPDIPDYDSEENVLLVYPGKHAKTLPELFDNRKCPNLPFKKVVFIDSTWNQSPGIYKDPRLISLPTIVLRGRVSQFWRHQKNKPEYYLATIEAVHELLVEIDAEANATYDGKYDDLLFFFRFMYNKIQTMYDRDKLLSYKRRGELKTKNS